jgi:hypothetical protein
VAESKGTQTAEREAAYPSAGESAQAQDCHAEAEALDVHLNPYTVRAYNDPFYRGLLGIGELGDVTSQQINAIVTTGAQTTIRLLAAFGALTGPIGAAIGGLVAMGSLIANMFQGCGQTCIVASNDANKIEPLLQQNLEAYLSAPVRTHSMQAAALNNFDTIWNALRTACSDPSLGAAGKNCIVDRQSGACHYKTTPGGWQGTQYVYPGSNGSGTSCWNWFVGYRDPIANDPNVQPDSAVLSVSSPSPQPGVTDSSITSSNSAPGSFFSSPLSLLLIAAAAWFLLGGGD